MNAIGPALVLAAVLCPHLLASADSADTDTVDVATRQVRAAEQAFADAFAARDLDRFAAFIHPTAVFSGRDGPLQGKEQVLAVWSRYFESDTRPFSWMPETVLASADGRMASTTGPVKDSSGTWVGAFASTWMRQSDGSWQVVFDISPACPPLRGE